MSYKRITSVPVTEGGTGISSTTAYAPVCGGTTTTGALQVASTGQSTAGFVLTSTGSGSLPTWQAVAGGGGVVTINGDSGSATGGTINLIGTTNQMETAAGADTVTWSLSSTLVAPGSVTVTSGFTVSAGTITLTPLNASGIVVNDASGVITTSATTNHRVQIGNASGQLTSLAAGTSGQLLQSAGASDPAWTTSTYPSTTAQGDLLYASASNTISALTKSTTATRYLANTGTSNNPAWDHVNMANGVTGTLPVANGGTGDASFTAYAVICGGTTSTGALQNVSGVGTAGQILTSNGAGALPSWSSVTPAGVSSINGTSNQISASAMTGAVTLSIPSTFIAPGTIASTTTNAAGTFFLLPTTSSTAGQLRINNSPVLHSYGTHQMFVGDSSGNFTLTTGTAINNTGIGASSLSSLTTGASNSCLGWQTGTSITTGDHNVILGSLAGTSITTGDRNVLIGFGAGNNYVSSETDNIILGVSNGTAGESNQLIIGDGTGTSTGQLNRAKISGIFGKTSSSGTAVFINSNNVLGTSTSSERYKTNIVDIGDYSDILHKMRPVAFNFKEDVLKERGDVDVQQYGLIAEEVAKLDKRLVMFNKGQPDAIRYHFLVPLLLNELQKAFKRIEVLEKKVGV